MKYKANVKYKRPLGLLHSIGFLLITFFPCGIAHAQDVKLDAPQVVSPSEKFDVSWEGPISEAELIVIAEPEAAVYATLSMAATVDGSPVTFTAPTSGTYEIRYITFAGMKILASVPLQVTGEPKQTEPVSALSNIGDNDKVQAFPVLFALLAVDRDAEFHVIWTGDGNEGDRLLLRDERSAIVAEQPLLSDTPMRFTAPSEPGHYSLQYFHKTSRMIAFRRELEVR